MSVERFCPEAGAWEMVKEMRKKRWGDGARGLGPPGRSALAGEAPASERAYNACVVTRPWNWDFPD